MDQEIVTGYAGQRLGRLGHRGYKGGYGYGLYFTHDRVVGISYKKLVARANVPGYLLEVIGFAILGLLLAYFGLTRPPPNETIPVWLGLIFLTMFGMLIASLYFQLGRSPRQAAIQISHEEAKALASLSNLQYDVSLERVNISQVQIDFLQISIQTKNGQWYLFGVQDTPKGSVRTRLVSLFREFCSQSPPVTMFVKNQNKQWDLISKAENIV